MFSNPLFQENQGESRDNINPNDISDIIHHENFSFKPPVQGNLDQARNSINNLMLKFEKPKKKDKKEEDDDDFKLLTESFMINLDKLNTSQMNYKPWDIDLNPQNNKNSLSLPKISEAGKNSNINLAYSSSQYNIIEKIKPSNPDLHEQDQYKTNQDQYKTNQDQYKTNQLTLESQNILHQETIKKLEEDHHHLLSEMESLHCKITTMEQEKNNILVKNKEYMSEIASLSQQLTFLTTETKNQTQNFISNKEALSLQYEKQLIELRNTIQLNENLLRNSTTKETYYEALQAQMQQIQTSNSVLQTELSNLKSLLDSLKAKNQSLESINMNLNSERNELLKVLENSKLKFEEQELFQIETIEKLKNNLKQCDQRESFYREELQNRENRLKDYESLLENKDKDFKEQENRWELYEERVFSKEAAFLQEKAKFEGLETQNNELNQLISQLQENLRVSTSNLEEKESLLMEKEAAFREKYQRLEDLYINSKEIIDSYNREMEDYKLEKELLIKQLLEEKSRNQQERVSFTGQRTIFEEAARKFEYGITEKEQKIKGLMEDLTQKESFIRMSLYDKNMEFEKIKGQFSGVIERKEREINEITSAFKKEKERLERVLKEKEILIKEKEEENRENKGFINQERIRFDHKIKELEGLLREKGEKEKRNEDRVKELKEDSESLRREIKEIKELNQKSNAVLEEKIRNLKKNQEKMVLDEDFMKKREYELENAKLTLEERIKKKENDWLIEKRDLECKIKVEKVENVKKGQIQTVGFNPFLKPFEIKKYESDIEKENYQYKPFEDNAQKNTMDYNNNNYYNYNRSDINNYEKDNFYRSNEEKKTVETIKPYEFQRDLNIISKNENLNFENNRKYENKSSANIINNQTYGSSSTNLEKKYPSPIKNPFLFTSEVKSNELITLSEQNYPNSINDKKTDKATQNKEIFQRKDTIREEDIYHEVLALKKEVFEALKSYQKLLSSIQTKKVSSHNLKKYIGDNLHNVFLSYSKILFLFFKPNISFFNVLNLQLYIGKTELMLKKIFSKSQYMSFKNIYLETGGSKEKEINELMSNCNDFIIEFYEFIRRRREKDIPKIKKKYIDEQKISELFCGFCNEIFPVEIYKSHVSTCNLYKGNNKVNNLKEDNKLVGNGKLELWEQRNKLIKLVDMVILRINSLEDSQNKSKIMNLMISLKSEGNQARNRDYLIKEIIDIMKEIGQNVVGMLISRILQVLENKGSVLDEIVCQRINNIQSD